MRRGRPPKGAPKGEASVRLTVRAFPLRLRDGLNAEAERRGTTAAELVRVFVAKGLGLPVEAPPEDAAPPAEEAPVAAEPAAPTRPHFDRADVRPGRRFWHREFRWDHTDPRACEVISADAKGVRFSALTRAGRPVSRVHREGWDDFEHAVWNGWLDDAAGPQESGSAQRRRRRSPRPGTTP